MSGFNETSSAIELKNTGLLKYNGTSGQPKHIIFVPKGSEFAGKVPALTKQTWVDNQNAAMADRYFVLPQIFNFEPEQAEATREEGNTGMTSFVDDGKLTYKMTLQEIHIKNLNDIFSLNNGSFDGYIITDKSFIEGYSPDGVKFRPYSFEYTRILPSSENTKEANSRVGVEIKFKDVRQRNQFRVNLDCVNDADVPASWYPDIELPLSQPKVVNLTLTAVGATSFAFTIKSADGVAYPLAVKEDIYLRKTTVDGTLIPITSIAYVSNGNYTGVIGTQTTGTFYCSLLPQPDATTQGVETEEGVASSLAVTI